MVDIANTIKGIKKNFTLPSREGPHIYRDPPKSYIGRKKERVSESDVMWVTRPDGPDGDNSRINEGIKYWANGINPSVAVNYQNFNAGGSRTTTMPSVQAKSVYRLDRVIPPITPAESLLPLSRPRVHQNIIVRTNPGISNAFNNNQLQQTMDKHEINDIISIPKSNGLILAPTAFYKMDTPQILQISNQIRNNPLSYTVSSNIHIPKSTDIENFDVNKAVRDDSMQYTVYSNISDARSTELTEESLRNNKKSEVKDQNLILDNITSGYQIVIYDPSTHNHSEIVGSIKDKNNISVSAALNLPLDFQTPNGCTKKIRDYTYKIVKSNASQDKLVITLKENENIQLERNIPMYAATSNPCDLNGSEQCNSRTNLSGKEQKASHIYSESRDYTVNNSNENRTNNIQSLREKPIQNSVLSDGNNRMFSLGKKFRQM